MKEGDEWKLIAPSGQELVRVRANMEAFPRNSSVVDIDAFSDGFAVLTLDCDRSTLIDEHGQVPFREIYAAGPMSEGLAAVSSVPPALSMSRWGYVAATGEKVISERFLLAGPFHGGLAAVSPESGGWCLIDKRGAPVVKLEGISLAFSPSEGRVAAQSSTSRLWGYLDVSGRQAIPFQYVEARSFSNGRAAVRVPGAGGWGFVDRDGKMAIPTGFDSAERFEDGRAEVTANGQRAMIDVNGNIVWRMHDETVEKPAGP